jgi:hypothetical protein
MCRARRWRPLRSARRAPERWTCSARKTTGKRPSTTSRRTAASAERGTDIAPMPAASPSMSVAPEVSLAPTRPWHAPSPAQLQTCAQFHPRTLPPSLTTCAHGSRRLFWRASERPRRHHWAGWPRCRARTARRTRCPPSARYLRRLGLRGSRPGVWARATAGVWLSGRGRWARWHGRGRQRGVGEFGVSGVGCRVLRWHGSWRLRGFGEVGVGGLEGGV